MNAQLALTQYIDALRTTYREWEPPSTQADIDRDISLISILGDPSYKLLLLHALNWCLQHPVLADGSPTATLQYLMALLDAGDTDVETFPGIRQAGFDRRADRWSEQDRAWRSMTRERLGELTDRENRLILSWLEAVSQEPWMRDAFGNRLERILQYWKHRAGGDVPRTCFE